VRGGTCHLHPRIARRDNYIGLPGYPSS
jgi:hypothetical protein